MIICYKFAVVTKNNKLCELKNYYLLHLCFLRLWQGVIMEWF